MGSDPSPRTHRGSHHYAESRPALFLIGIAIGATLIGAVWGGLWLDSARDGGDAVSGANLSAPVSGTARSAPEQGQEQAPEQGGAGEPDPCLAVYERQAAAMRSGAAPLSQWKVHIGAMNQLVTGVITLEQATAFWDDTRVGAARKLARFRSAHRDLEASEEGCPGTERSHEMHDEGSCAAAVAARAPALRALDTALATWGEHVRHMEMLRLGHMSPEEAGQLWLASWRTGVAQVRGYQQAARESRHAHC
jgi:hypothetical protein